MTIIALDVENLDMEYIFAETKVISSKLPQILVIQVETAEMVEQMCLQANKQKLQEQFDVSVKFICFLHCNCNFRNKGSSRRSSKWFSSMTLGTKSKSGLSSKLGH